MTRKTGLEVSAPDQECGDKHCPFHAGLPTRGRVFDGRATNTKARKTVTLQKEAPLYMPKFKRYARSKSTIHAHLPECMSVEPGDSVKAVECRPISKSVSFVVVEVRS